MPTWFRAFSWGAGDNGDVLLADASRISDPMICQCAVNLAQHVFSITNVTELIVTDEDLQEYDVAEITTGIFIGVTAGATHGNVKKRRQLLCLALVFAAATRHQEKFA